MVAETTYLVEVFLTCRNGGYDAEAIWQVALTVSEIEALPAMPSHIKALPLSTLEWRQVTESRHEHGRIVAYEEVEEEILANRIRRDYFVDYRGTRFPLELFLERLHAGDL